MEALKEPMSIRSLLVGVLWGLSACGGQGSLPSDGGSSRRDAGGPEDAMTVSVPDAGTAAGGDAGSKRDGGPIVVPDAGVVTCRLEPATSALKRSGWQQEHDLADLSGNAGYLAFASSWNHQRMLGLVDATTLATVFPKATDVVQEEILSMTGAAIPRAVDVADGLAFVAGNFDATGSTPFTKITYMDYSGTESGTARTDDFTAMAAKREKTGGRVLALGKPVGTEQPVYMNRYGPDGTLTSSFEVGRDARKSNQWDFDWLYDDDQGLACGVSLDGLQEMLTTFQLSADLATPRRTSEKIAAVTTADGSAFGCRIAVSADGAVVALAEGDGGARLLWLNPDGTIRAGPMPFSAYKLAFKYDVAANGKLTALAHLDESTGTPHVVVRIFPTPAGTPIELYGEKDLNLGTFDLVGRRVRLARIDGGFALAFDASIKIGQTDLFVRRILCE